jgi:hypothetical protein
MSNPPQQMSLFTQEPPERAEKAQDEQKAHEAQIVPVAPEASTAPPLDLTLAYYFSGGRQ